VIEEIRISNLGVITDATLPLGKGLSVVTGETGAGKTRVVTALGMLLGARADAGAVRTGARSAVAEAVLRLSPDSPALARAAEAGASIEEYDGDAELMLVRTVNADGRSRAHVGGRTAPVGTLAEIGGQLVAVHGQSDQLRLRSQSAQREALDKFAGPKLAKPLAAYRKAYGRWREASGELQTLRSEARERLREAEALQLALEEIDRVDPQPGEDELLKAEATKLANVEQLRAAALLAHQALVAEEFTETGDATSLVDTAKRTLEQVQEEDPELGKAAGRLAEVGYIIADVAAELASYGASLDSEGPERLAELEARRSDLAVLVRKYAPSVDEVLEWAAVSRARLDELTDDSSRIEALESELATLDAELASLSGSITAVRAKAASDLGKKVGQELTALAMPDAKLQIDVEPAGELGPHGADNIAFLLKPHPGAPARPLGKGASGGELSRVMLAIEVVLAAVDPVPTFVFDEVDSGVGGKAAVEIGRRLAMLARYVQVIVVTHLPQVAAFADHHIRVYKSSTKATAKDDGVTASDVRLLTDEERVTELARMLAGQEESELARAHAQELIDAAKPRER
jgi:DNA repair protein RecN (Recombination protein N)